MSEQSEIIRKWFGTFSPTGSFGISEIVARVDYFEKKFPKTSTILNNKRVPYMGISHSVASIFEEILPKEK